MQTVTVIAERNRDCVFFKLANMNIAFIFESPRYKSKYIGWISGNIGFCNDCSYPEALEFVSTTIEKQLAKIGLNVEFK